MANRIHLKNTVFFSFEDLHGNVKIVDRVTGGDIAEQLIPDSIAGPVSANHGSPDLSFVMLQFDLSRHKGPFLDGNTTFIYDGILYVGLEKNSTSRIAILPLGKINWFNLYLPVPLFWQ